jgi:predicted AlkP superfamily phosphohydrolase/phosphomutase
MRRVLAIFLDGYEQSLGRRLMSAGEMPAMSRLAASSARFLLDYGPAQRTGLAGEHVATGLSPEAARRWTAVHFDRRSYRVWQEGTRLRPFAADLNCRTVVFDAPYFDLNAAPEVRGLVSWGAHDPGVAQAAHPSELLAEFHNRFGAYPATRWIYGLAWPSVENSRSMGLELARAVDLRAEAARWMLGERFPDWDLALVAVSEPHSVIEALWHGIDPTHPLHRLPSAIPAGVGIRAVYQAVDRLIGKLTAAFPDAQTVVFALGGMGANRSDVASMLLLPELMYRRAFGSAFFRQPQEWSLSTNTLPVLPPNAQNWHDWIAARFPRTPGRAEDLGHPTRLSLAWVPATAYQPFWRSMPAFALPSYYDGRVRLNLIGREDGGMVRVEDYRRALAEVESLIRACIDPATGESAVDYVEYPMPQDPREQPSTQADLVVVWKGAAVCLEHPSLGRIGPVPYRRTGGHTGPYGMAYIRADNGLAGDHGIRSAFDVVPTIIDLMGYPRNRSLSGASLFSRPASDGDPRRQAHS